MDDVMEDAWPAETSFSLSLISYQGDACHNAHHGPFCHMGVDLVTIPLHI